jgi:hypothetical protein
LAYVKNPLAGNAGDEGQDLFRDRLVAEALGVYRILNKDEGREELVRVMKFHSLDSARLHAGLELLQLGARADVESALQDEKSDFVARYLKQALL